MNLTRGNIAKWFVMLTIGLAAGCGHAMKPAIHLDSGFQPRQVDVITLLPAIDARLDRAEKVDIQTQLNNMAQRLLTKRGYEIQIIDANGAESPITKDDLKAADSEWIKRLGPSNANWVMVLVLDDVTTKLTFGSTGNAEVSGFMFDKQAGKTVWRDKGIGKAGQGGLLGMTLKGVMGGAAVAQAVTNLSTSVPPVPKE